ncbi:N-6 DNA methylase [Patescibacteria group bacterium]|nr:N-6 DNA methylase [Patescibacteria group bacterium]MBU1895327.1 N-6 DNA methylase [Patescibacteria group bacterium]
MLDQTTKHKIDTARQILVGKVPDPKAQVEQITTALIYKFMDDMDRESVELGGKANFFTDGFSQYAWTKLLDNKLSGQERLDLYVQALDNIPKNPDIPQLFRNIFKGAFLPFRDPRTLSLFLKEINQFTYDHSENLGNAFEYLLSIMGSQGDAGQFRTPRHIIDFIVEIVDPKKNDTILDPACGTAGFLISAYKHILGQHDGKNDITGKPTNEEKHLTPDEKKKLMNNFVGYDISPDMVKLSLVNLYLHGFPKPKIHEYDTLSDEKRWDETFDVILANPPFMTPKGGIRPHKRFSVQAKRAEVLFVDYIAEHLNINGRAGIIVPEGIIFQSSNAYKSLRKNLIENWGLYAVVSMPAGIFQPYSGVKTSILLLDRALAKKTNEILFVKIENDGFGLGAQRRKINKNDLPTALKVLKTFQQNPTIKDLNVLYEKVTGELPAIIGTSVIGGSDPIWPKNIAVLVEKREIEKSGDYNLTRERYTKNILIDNEYNLEEIGSVAEVVSGSGFPKKYQGNTEGIPFIKVSDMNSNGNEMYIITANNFVTADILKEIKGKACPKGTVVFPKIGAAIATNKKRILSESTAFDNNVMGIVPGETLIPEFLYYLLLSFDLVRWSSNSSLPSMRASRVKEEKIPLPPLEIQKQIVAELDGYQKIIDGARQVVENWKPTIKVDPEWKKVKLGEVCEVDPKKTEVKELPRETMVSFLPMVDLSKNRMVVKPYQEKTLNDVYKGYTYFIEDDVLLAKVTPCFENGKAGIAKNLINQIGFGSSEYMVLRSSKVILPELVYCFIKSPIFHSLGINHMTGTGGLQRLSKQFVKTFRISLPPLEIQREIVAEIKAEQKMVNFNKKLIEIYQQKIINKINEVWGKK